MVYIIQIAVVVIESRMKSFSVLERERERRRDTVNKIDKQKRPNSKSIEKTMANELHFDGATHTHTHTLYASTGEPRLNVVN